MASTTPSDTTNKNGTVDLTDEQTRELAEKLIKKEQERQARAEKRRQEKEQAGEKPNSYHVFVANLRDALLEAHATYKNDANEFRATVLGLVPILDALASGSNTTGSVDFDAKARDVKSHVAMAARMAKLLAGE